MNRLIRGIGVRCTDGLARGRHAPVPPVLRGALPRHITPTASRDGDASSSSSSAVGLGADRRVEGTARGFSTAEAAPRQQQEQQVLVGTSPSALEMASQLPPTSPGHALSALQRFAATKRAPKGKRPPPFGPIRQSDFVALCESSKPGSFKDGKVVATALREFKRNSRFVLDTDGAESAVRGMLRSMTRNHPDGSGRAAGAIFVLDQVLDESTGLYFAIETRLVDEVLDVLHSALLEMQASGIDVRVGPAPEEGEEGGDAPSEEPADRHALIVRDALRTTLGVNDMLVRRKSRPERELKKRAKRKYLSHLQIGSGPYRTTLRLATKITLLVSDAKTARERIVEPFNLAWWTKFVDEEVLEMVSEAEGREEEERRAAEAALPQEEESDEADGEGEDADEDSQDNDDAETEQKS